MPLSLFAGFDHKTLLTAFFTRPHVSLASLEIMYDNFKLLILLPLPPKKVSLVLFIVKDGIQGFYMLVKYSVD